jgi:hypothetical protein
MTGSGDSAVVVARYAYPAGYSYILQRGPQTSTLQAGDTIITYCYFYDKNSALLYSVAVDSVIGTASAGKSVMLPINRTDKSAYVSIVWKSTATLSTRKSIQPASVSIQKRRVILTTKTWQ